MNKEDLDKKLAKWEAKAKTCIKWIAVNKDGAIWGFATKPQICIARAMWSVSGYIGYLGATEDEGLCKNWDKTLRKVNYE